MSTIETALATPRKPIRVWPGLIAVALQWIGWFVVPAIFPQAALVALLSGVIGGLAIIVWWLLFSRAPWIERIAALVLIVLALIGTKRLVHESIAGGAMGMLLYVLAIPVFSMGLVLWAVVSRHFSAAKRRLAFVGMIVLCCGVFMLVRTGGLTAEFNNDLHWRWSKTPEQRLLAQTKDETATPASSSAPASTESGWSGFRGPQRDGTVPGVRIKTDWSASPPIEMWRRPIGPAWSSFAVQNGRIYTQEQRGEEEVVSCYDVNTGKPIWRHSDNARFYESNGGAGPRATPTLSNGRVYTQGATGIVNALDAGTGDVVWTRNSVNDTGAKVPGWGIAGSPLVVNDLVIVAASGNLVAYEVASGKQRWLGPAGGSGYSSPQLLTINGIQQIVLLRSTGATSVSLTDGKLLWEHAWDGVPIVQPAVASNGDLLISVSESSGLRRLTVGQGSGGWTTQERWTSEDINPWFNDFVVHKGYAFGFNGSNLVCINLEDGKLKWTGKRYGYGQLVLLPDQDLLVILSEQGELAVAKAATDQFTELAHFPALEGKTWNHPVIVGNILLVRNDHEMAAFKLTSEGG